MTYIQRTYTLIILRSIYFHITLFYSVLILINNNLIQINSGSKNTSKILRLNLFLY